MTTKEVGSSGPTPTKILIIGEAPGGDEEKAGEPFIGSSGRLLNEMLHEAGMDRDDIRITNVCRVRPPRNKIDAFFLTKTEAKKQKVPEYSGKYPNWHIRRGLIAMEEEIRSCKPNLIIPMGNTSLWALTGEWGITKWRGSVMDALDTHTDHRYKVIPTYHPAAILYQWPWRFVCVHDLRKCKEESESPEIPDPGYDFKVRPSAHDVLVELSCILLRLNGGETISLGVDIETRYHRHIACLGIAWTTSAAMCIPFMERSGNYWSEYDEKLIIEKLRVVLTHPNACVIMQNGAYDCQYIARWWGFVPRVTFDTMIAQRVLFPGAPANLNYISSMHNSYHRYWKDEGKDWEDWMDEEQGWVYNCKDCVATYEASFSQERSLKKCNLWDAFQEEMGNFNPVLRMMLRGVLIDTKRKGDMALDMQQYIAEREEWFIKLLGDIRLTKTKTAKPWYRSPQQLMTLFYEVIGLKKIYKRTKDGYRPTVDDDALKTISLREPLLKPLCVKLKEYRTCNVLLTNVLLKPLDHDERMRCSYSIAAAETMRFTSSEDAFGLGTNLQNITSGTEDEH